MLTVQSYNSWIVYVLIFKVSYDSLSDNVLLASQGVCFLFRSPKRIDCKEGDIFTDFNFLVKVMFSRKKMKTPDKKKFLKIPMGFSKLLFCSSLHWSFCSFLCHFSSTRVYSDYTSSF